MTRRRENRAKLSKPKSLEQQVAKRTILQIHKLARGTVQTGGLPPRNAHCFCGSEKKFKHCCGAGETAYRFTLLKPDGMEPWRNNEGKVLVFSSRPKALQALRAAKVEGMRIGGMGATKWNLFQDHFRTKTESGEVSEGWVLDSKTLY